MNRYTSLLLARLSEVADDVRLQWNNPEGTSTRHFVVDNVFPPEEATRIYNAFPRDGKGFFSRESFREKKKTSAELSSYGEVLSLVTYAFQDPQVIKYVEGLIGFSGLEPDPKLYAGGLSMMFEGDYLNPHIDNSHDSDRQRYRRLNLLYYVSPDWALDNGGNFELWDAAVKVPKTIVSKENRLVVMETNKTSWHSVSPVRVDRPRCCVSNYYFSKSSPDQSRYFHVTSFSGRPEQSLRRIYGMLDNSLRNLAAKTLGLGRGKDLVNKQK